jgi:hypothetical protein
LVLRGDLKSVHGRVGQKKEETAGGGENAQVLEVATGQLVVGDDLNLALALLLDDDLVAQVADATIDLDLVLEELLEGGRVEDLIASGLRSVDDELLTTRAKIVSECADNWFDRI